MYFDSKLGKFVEGGAPAPSTPKKEEPPKKHRFSEFVAQFGNAIGETLFGGNR